MILAVLNGGCQVERGAFQRYCLVNSLLVEPQLGTRLFVPVIPIFLQVYHLCSTGCHTDSLSYECNIQGHKTQDGN